ncbi:MAG: RNA-binding protein [Rickettsiales bacterium]|nr:RNA-binding protein [Rickettsiales bacterium]|tara:strand:+ start:6176 stop:6457 length:282 start_codon:yes stop_codon:yes gene_type:complete
MTAKLFVGNLPYSCTDDDLRSVFTSTGCDPLDVRVIMDRSTGLSKGFGFVEVEDKDTAVAVRDALVGAVLGDRNLIIDLARPPATNSAGKIRR